MRIEIPEKEFDQLSEAREHVIGLLRTSLHNMQPALMTATCKQV